MASDAEVLSHLPGMEAKREADEAGGAGQGKSKDQSGTPLCFSWASGTGVCGKLPPGAECLGAVKRAHISAASVSPRLTRTTSARCDCRA